MNRRFVAGSAVQNNGGTRDCLQGCNVTLLRDEVQAGQAVTDWFGDFKIDGLPDESLAYTLVFEHPENETVRISVRSDEPWKSVGVAFPGQPSKKEAVGG